MGVLWIGLGEPLVNVVRAQFWEEVPCTILSSAVEGRKTYRVAIHYEYETGQVRREGSRYSFVTGSTSGRDSKQKVVDQYPVGKQTVCYVNPNNVSESVINRNFQWAMLVGLVGIPFAAVGAGGCHALMSQRRKKHQAETEIDTDSEKVSAMRDDITMHDEAFTHHALHEEPGPITLKPESGRLGAFVALLVLGLIWNAIVSIFAFQMVGDIRKGDHPWILGLFVSGFGLVGLALLVGAIYSFLKLFNPIPVLVLERTQLPLGGTGTVRWTFRGSTRSLHDFKISLESIERVTYVRGTNTSTEDHKLLENVLYESMEPSEIERGEITVEIPTDAMHSFEALNNKIVWRLKVHGSLRFWPDVNEIFPIRVVPHE